MQAYYNINLTRLVLFFLVVSFCSCRASYNQNIMFKTTGNINVDKLRQSLTNVERNYVIQPNDYLDIRVYTNKGERIFDPNGELPFGTPSGGLSSGGSNRSGQQASNTEFLVQYDGTVKLPLVDIVQVSGYTLLQADSLLQPLFNEYYEDSFVRTTVTNNRVFVLGAIGGSSGSVIPMQNDNMNLLEVLAQAGGIQQGGKAQNIKIIRNYMSPDPIVQIIDLTTINGMRQASLHIEPNDVIYVEPNQRIFFEVLRDVTPVLSTFISLVSTYLLITNLNNN